MQIVRLSEEDAIRAGNTQVLVDPQGEASLFWFESPPGAKPPIFIPLSRDDEYPAACRAVLGCCDL
jgi:hypothetical protein